MEVSAAPWEGRFQRLNKILGKGANKEVFLAFDTVKNNDVAWNTMVVGQQSREVRESEIGILQQCDHPHIIKYYAMWENENYFIFITEFFSGSLREYIRDRDVLVKSVKTWVRQILSGLAYLHNQGIIHRDIKCENIFINQKTGDVVIGDLGLSRIDNHEGRSMTMVGTVPFMAPEQLDLDDRQYDTKVDIYALGMSVIEMITTEYPYDEVNNIALVIRNIMENRLPNAFLRIIESDVKIFITMLLTRNPTERPSATDLLNDEWLNSKTEDETKFCSSLLIAPNEAPCATSALTQQTPTLADVTPTTKPAATNVMATVEADNIVIMEDSPKRPATNVIVTPIAQPSTTLTIERKSPMPRQLSEYGSPYQNVKPVFLFQVPPTREALSLIHI